jgi:hypothetical protein
LQLKSAARLQKLLFVLIPSMMQESNLDEIKASELAAFLQRLSAPYMRRKQKWDQAESFR